MSITDELRCILDNITSVSNQHAKSTAKRIRDVISQAEEHGYGFECRAALESIADELEVED